MNQRVVSKINLFCIYRVAAILLLLVIGADPATPSGDPMMGNWGGKSASLLRKECMVPALSATGQLPVSTLTFSVPPGGLNVRIGCGDVAKIVIPGYKPKSYSVSAERPGEFDVTFKLYPNGRCSGYLDSLAVGDSISVFGKGRKERRKGTHVGFVAFGVGITEALPIAAAELEAGDAQEVRLLWGARTFGDMFWHGEVAALEKKYPGRFRVTRMLSREDREGCRRGRIDGGVLAGLFGDWKEVPGARFLSVGTKAMMRDCHEMLKDVGFDVPGRCSLLLNP